MSKHGGWEWDGNPCDYDPENEAPWLLDENGNPVLTGTIKCVSPEHARLIAAAPDLLQALFELLAMCERQEDFNDDGDGMMFDRAHAAIAKAKNTA